MEKAETKIQSQKIFTFDATGQAPGRLATQVVNALLGKNQSSYQRHLPAADCKVEITNISELSFTGGKLAKRVYYHHTGYLGHLKETRAKDIFSHDPRQYFKKIIRGMLPKNKWRDKLIKQIVFK